MTIFVACSLDGKLAIKGNKEPSYEGETMSVTMKKSPIFKEIVQNIVSKISKEYEISVVCDCPFLEESNWHICCK